MTGKLAEALAKAQGDMKFAKKDTENTYFKSSYADLAAVWDACRKPLSDNGLSIVQTTLINEHGDLVLKTALLHSSGESIDGIMPIQVGEKANAQQVGSAITYARRYALAAIVGVAPQGDDDDGNAASEHPKGKKQVSAGLRTKRFEEALAKARSPEELDKAIKLGNDLLLELRSTLPEAHDELQRKISKFQEAFQLAEAAE